MNYKRREEIFSKEVITLDEMAELLSCDKSTACVKIKDMKRKVGDRLGISGRIHIQDYLNWLNLDKDVCKDRYIRPEDLEAATKLERMAEAREKASVFTMPSSELQKQFGDVSRGGRCG